MTTPLDVAPEPAPGYISTGSLPVPDRVQRLVDEAHARYAGVADGLVSEVYPALAAVAPERFGLVVVGVDGRDYRAGDATTPFTIMSVAKPFTFALLCEAIGADEATREIGANATGSAFNAISATEAASDGRTNPMVNAGAIATVGRLPGGNVEDRWSHLLEGLSAFAGRELHIDEPIYASASESNHRNRSLAYLLHSLEALASDPDDTVEIYTRVSCLQVTALDLATMGSVLADGGLNPVTRQRVIDLETCRAVLSAMVTAGLYEASGEWLFEIGLPGKSGIGGGIVTVSPGKGALGTFSPPLDPAGNSVRGRLATRWLSRGLGLDLFASTPR